MSTKAETELPSINDNTELTDAVTPDEVSLDLAKQASKQEYKELAIQGLWKN
ncbi:MAG: hypothetical protein JKX76_06500, partial [Colwellia sp.]|nr:hypothetical protein [Colwellia sp.]